MTDHFSLQEQSSFLYWYPKINNLLESERIPIPETIILKLSDEIQKAIWISLDGEKPPEDLDLSLLYSAVYAIGYPAFIRTEMGSGKHDFDKCCYLKEKNDLYAHLVNLLEWSECVDFIGLPFNYLIIRKYLKPIYGFKAFLGMPVAKEFRFFVCDGKYVCHHFYWPEEAIEVYGDYILPDDWKDQLSALSVLSPDDYEELKTYTERFGSVLPGNWSVDFMRSEEGWVMIDAARAEHSWHPYDCQNQLFWQDSEGMDGGDGDA